VSIRCGKGAEERRDRQSYRHIVGELKQEDGGPREALRSQATHLCSLTHREVVMGMRIGSSGAAAASQSVGVGNWQQRQQSFKDLFSALQAGDLGAAQKAFSGLTGASGAVKGNGALAQIGKALQSGDIAGAQQAAQAMLASRGGHHHHQGGQVVAATSPATPASGTGSLLNLTA
jgi:hypothetical protein